MLTYYSSKERSGSTTDILEDILKMLTSVKRIRKTFITNEFFKKNK